MYSWYVVWKLVIRVCLCFFFQAEDGIRDLVRSRGLGDVYKRQPLTTGEKMGRNRRQAQATRKKVRKMVPKGQAHISVSYTHLTLPTSDLV